ncbi:hypothetical protein [Candidatus Erwinia haradaeae]|uniref:hypothetical protein n=1 Tax=Candidatus Erwinia haradaeae TaxID=1922217 RepID=UPI0013007C9C|nr:hypothetical protein [Candidatus Erwinia haradaeae]
MQYKLDILESLQVGEASSMLAVMIMNQLLRCANNIKPLHYNILKPNITFLIHVYSK